MVFFQHYSALPWGWAGVNVFFVLSGFLITGILFDSRDDTHRAKNFYIRRALRIFPLYYGVLLATLILNPLLHWRWSFYWFAWPLYFANSLHFPIGLGGRKPFAARSVGMAEASLDPGPHPVSWPFLVSLRGGAVLFCVALDRLPDAR